MASAAAELLGLPVRPRPEVIQQARLPQQLQGSAAVRVAEDLLELVADAFGGDGRELLGVGRDRGERDWLDREPQSGGETDGAQQAEVILSEARRLDRLWRVLSRAWRSAWPPT